jgi:CRP/FNR family cyclic AMP-dependent transcriptional regulator
MAERSGGGITEKRKLLMQIDLFAHLSPKEADSVLALMREQRIKKNTVVFHQFDETGGMYLILDGSVKISRVGRDGREVTISVLGKGNFFGEMSLLDGQPRSATATATTAARLLVLERDSFQSGILPLTGIVAKMLLELSKRLRAADQSIENLALGTVFDRIFHFMGHLGRRFPIVDDRCVITKRPTHQELAELVGSSRETVTRTLASMEKKGLIEIHKREIILLPAFFVEELSRA